MLIEKILKEKDGWTQVKATVPNNREVLTELHSLEDDIRILGPSPLIKHFKHCARSYYEFYLNGA